MDFDQVQKEVRFHVRESTSETQTPWFSESSSAILYLKRSQGIAEDELVAWRSALGTGKNAVRKFLSFYSVSDYAAAARRWLSDNSGNAEAFSTRISPLAPEFGWESSAPSATPAPIVVARVSGPIGLDGDVQDLLPPISASFEQLVLAPAAPAQAAQQSGRILVAHGEGIALGTVEGCSEPTESAPVAESFEFGDSITVGDVAFPKLNETWLKVRGTDFSPWSYVLLPPGGAPSVEIGEPSAELTVTGKPDRLPTLADVDEMVRTISDLKSERRSVSWVSIATPKTESSKHQDLLALRATHISQVLVENGVPRPNITTAQEQEFAGDDIRVRIFTTKGGEQ
ncbi:MAG: hypothetical protein H0T75_14385 [Rhizobiales bacterium]|nr:hypothetical protein [Hyphomicrobiales bacterium]